MGAAQAELSAGAAVVSRSHPRAAISVMIPGNHAQACATRTGVSSHRYRPVPLQVVSAKGTAHEPPGGARRHPAGQSGVNR